MPEREVVFIEFAEGRPNTVITLKDGRYSEFDFHWSRVDGRIYWHEAGNRFDGAATMARYADGGRPEYWAAPGFRVKRKREGKPIPLPEEWRDPFNHPRAEEGEVAWCSRCRSSIFITEVYGRPCPHIWWDVKACWWSTPDERRSDRAERAKRESAAPSAAE